MPIKTAIIEDEEKCLYVLESLISEYAAECRICGTAGHVEGAIRLIEEMEPQLVFIDIRIIDGTAFDVLKRLSSRNFELVFVTAFDSYAMEAIQLAACHYLLKPIGITEFEEALDRVRKRLAERDRYNSIDLLLHNLSQHREQDRKISIPTLSGFDFIDLHDILWCKSEGMYTVFHLTNKSKITSSRNIGVYEDLLGHNNFFRIHHSVLINMRWIQRYIKGKGGCVVLADGTELEVSQRRKGEFLDKFLM